MKKFIAITLFLGVFAGLTWYIWFHPAKEPGEEKKPEADVPVQVGKIARATLRSYVTAYGTVEPEAKAGARLAAGVPGVVSAVNCVEGQHVERGALLFEFDGRTAEVAVKFAEKSLDRQKRLSQAEATSQKLLQEAEQQLDSARAQQALLQVRSPISGTITKVNVKVGEVADLTTALCELVDLDHLVVSINVPSSELPALAIGQPVEILTTDSTNSLNTSLAFTGRQVDPKTGSGIARATLPANSGLRLGQFVKVRIVTAEHKDCLAVPLASVAKDPTGAYFIAVVEGEKATLKPVKVGVRDGDLVEVEGDGVELDKPVVTEGAYGLIMAQQFATKIRVVNE